MILFYENNERKFHIVVAVSASAAASLSLKPFVMLFIAKIYFFIIHLFFGNVFCRTLVGFRLNFAVGLNKCGRAFCGGSVGKFVLFWKFLL